MELLEDTGVFPEGQCLIGFSGGADSTMLIQLAAVLRDKGRLDPQAVHVNHGIRGEESDQDEVYCRQVCNELRIPIHTIRADLEGKRDEDSCRKERFRCFRKVMEQTGITNLVIGHNRDDLAETFLMRLIRGAGLEGLACMSGLDEHENFLIYRPLLRTGREEIRNVLRSAGIHWREDSSNGSNDYLRNRIRNSLIPVMNEMAEGAVNRIAQTAEILNLENQTLQEYADFYLAQHSSGSWLDFRAVQGIPQALQRRVLRNWWKMNRPETEEHSLNARQTESLVKLLNSERGKVNLPGGLIAVKGRHGMYLTGMPKRQIQEITFRPRIQEQICFGDFRLTILPSEGNPGNGTCTQEVPEKFFADCVIRTRKAGDRIRPFGMKGIRKLQDYLTDRRIDEPIRDEIPLICRGNEVLMVAGVGTGAVPIWNASEKNIRLKWQGRMPWDTDERSEKDNGSKE